MEDAAIPFSRRWIHGVKGDGYTLTQLDLEKITSLEMDVTGSSVTSENCELVLDTAENAIKLRIKATAY